MFTKKQKIYKTERARIKAAARVGLSAKVSRAKQFYVIDTSVAVYKALSRLIKKGLRGTIIIPNAVIAELENLANKNVKEGFTGLQEIAKLHWLKKKFKLKILFEGPRPSIQEIRLAKSGEIDAIIRNIAFKKHAILVTADLVQAKSAQAYGISVLFIRKRKKEKRKRRLFLIKR